MCLRLMVVVVIFVASEAILSPNASAQEIARPRALGESVMTTPSTSAAPLAGLTSRGSPASQTTPGVPTASGSCGPAQGSYGLTGISAEMFGPGARTVPALYYKVDYALTYPTTLALLVRYNDEVGGIEFILNSWGTPGTQGSFEGVWRADIRPEEQGEGDGYTFGSGKFDGPANSQWLSGLQSSYNGRGGIYPGGWHFYIYMGEWKLVGDRYRFNPDVTGPIGKFGCAVADDEAKN